MSMPHETSSSPPLLSVVVATDEFDTIRPVIAALRQQDVASRIEIVIVLPGPAMARVPRSELGGFAPTQIVPVETVMPLARARAAGVRAATAPVVFIGETHTYPEPGWAAALLAPFDDGWSAVVPAIISANRHGTLSWGSFLFDYGPWSDHRPAGELSDPLTYNLAYRRTVLLGLGDRLGEALDPRSEMMWPLLHAEGHRAWFARDARLRHLNVGRVGPLVLEKFSAGLRLGKHRASRWSRTRRALYLLATPLIPAVLIARVVRKVGLPPGWTAAAPAALIGSISKSGGEALGYLGADLPAFEARLTELEIHKVRYALPQRS